MTTSSLCPGSGQKPFNEVYCPACDADFIREERSNGVKGPEVIPDHRHAEFTHYMREWGEWTEDDDNLNLAGVADALDSLPNPDAPDGEHGLQEFYHRRGDALLLQALRFLGAHEVADAWERAESRAGFWYS